MLVCLSADFAFFSAFHLSARSLQRLSSSTFASLSLKNGHLPLKLQSVRAEHSPSKFAKHLLALQTGECAVMPWLKVIISFSVEWNKSLINRLAKLLKYSAAL
jgi:hypothetical protein